MTDNHMSIDDYVLIPREYKVQGERYLDHSQYSVWLDEDTQIGTVTMHRDSLDVLPHWEINGQSDNEKYDTPDEAATALWEIDAAK
jgi:hypothetical protein